MITNGKTQPAQTAPDLIDQYLQGGRVPWSPGYSKFKNKVLIETFGSPALMERFARHATLPHGYGQRLDERVVEIPWTISHIREGTGRILDAGSVLNTAFILGLPRLRGHKIFIWSLELDWLHLNSDISYIHGDFRESPFKERLFHTIVCISTLEHVGMWPIPKSPFDKSFLEPRPKRDFSAYRSAMREFRRLLVPGGQLLLTVPFGVKEDHGWTQVFDASGINDIKESFGAFCRSETFYRYRAEGWETSNSKACSDSRYFNIVRTPVIDEDGAAAARAVACLEFERTD